MPPMNSKEPNVLCDEPDMNWLMEWATTGTLTDAGATGEASKKETLAHRATRRGFTRNLTKPAHARGTRALLFGKKLCKLLGHRASQFIRIDDRNRLAIVPGDIVSDADCQQFDR